MQFGHFSYLNSKLIENWALPVTQAPILRESAHVDAGLKRAQIVTVRMTLTRVGLAETAPGVGRQAICQCGVDLILAPVARFDEALEQIAEILALHALGIAGHELKEAAFGIKELGHRGDVL
jgi:hypothetical protein